MSKADNLVSRLRRARKKLSTIRKTIVRQYNIPSHEAEKLMKEHRSFVNHYLRLGYDSKYIADVVVHTQSGIAAHKKALGNWMTGKGK